LRFADSFDDDEAVAYKVSVSLHIRHAHVDQVIIVAGE
jgi:hypothetical protein